MAEDVALCNAYLGISQCPIVGKDQSGTQSWDKVHENWVTETTTQDVERLPAALKLRMARINCDTAKFIAIHHKILKQNASGETPEDQIFNAKRIFNTVHKGEYLFIECWKVLKDAPRFRSLISSANASSEKLNNWIDLTSKLLAAV